MANELQIPATVPKHLLELQRVCQDHKWGRDIDEKSFTTIAFKMIEGKEGVIKEAASFISEQKSRLERFNEEYNKLRGRTCDFLCLASQATLPRPYGFSDSKIKALQDSLVALPAPQAETVKEVCKFLSLIIQ